MRTIPGALREAAERWPDHAAIVDGDTTLTFAQLHERVRRVAAGFGLEDGDRVCLWAPNSWRWEVAALAVTYAGGVLVPLNTRYTGHEVVDVVSRTNPRLIVIEDGFLGRTQSSELADAATEAGLVLPSVLVTSQLPDAEPVAFPEVAAADLADILFTSGTTGRSKGAMTAHGQSVEAARIWGELGEVTSDDRYLVVNPFFHSFGYKAGILVSLLYGATLYPQAVFDVNAAIDTIERDRITVLPGAPTIFNALLEQDRSTRDLSSLRFAVTGAAMVPVALVERMQSELSFDLVLTAFGMTECVMGAMGRRGDPPELVAGTTGRVVPGMEMRVDAPTGEDGELLFRGPLVMLGYLDDPIATAEAIDADGWLHTGDVARVDPEGNLKITDRLKDMYVAGGFNVYPAEIEQVIARLDGVVESAVVGLPDERLGEVGRAYVVRRAGAEITEEDVIAHCKERLANFKIPRSVRFVDVLPRNLAGKVLKTQLRSGGGL
ncbi:MAG TPA: FadD3 family acyl-CoA ligase [Nocardioidaceae bacterium]|nr:FadD3 family acyl-CoA ligase [Nocardioidaceae bacterium]